MKALFLNPPFVRRYDSAGARFQATRRTRSMWYPIWLAYGCAVSSESSDLLDAPARGIGIDGVVKQVVNYDIVVFYTSTPSFNNDVRVAERIKKVNPKIKIIFTGPHVSSLAKESLNYAGVIDGVVRGEFEYPVRDIILGKPWSKVKGLVYRQDNEIVDNGYAEPVRELDNIPFVSPIYKKYLNIRDYYLPFALIPYISIYAGRGCPYQCTFCSWPQSFTGRIYRKRSVDNVIEEVEYIKKNFFGIKEIFFDDDTFTVDKDWLGRFCEKIGKLKVKWSVNARADIDRGMLKLMKSSGCRLLVVGYESGNQKILDNVKKGIRLEEAIKFTYDCKKVGLMIHGTFILGLPGETKESIRQTIEFAKKLPLDTVQCSIVTPLPGTELYRELKEKGYLFDKSHLVSENGLQVCNIRYPHLSNEDIQNGAVDFHREFYFRKEYFITLLKHTFKNFDELYRVFFVGSEYIKFILKNRHF